MDRGRVYSDEKERQGNRVKKDTRSVIVGKFFQWATFSLCSFLKISLERTNYCKIEFLVDQRLILSYGEYLERNSTRSSAQKRIFYAYFFSGKIFKLLSRMVLRQCTTITGTLQFLFVNRKTDSIHDSSDRHGAR